MKKIIIACLALSAVGTLNAQAADPSLESCINGAQAVHKGRMLKLEKLDAESKSFYELEMKDSEGKEWEFMCDAQSGNITEQEGEVETADNAMFKSKAKLSEKAAADIALKAHPGTIEEVEYEIEANGDASYEFDIVDANGIETKVEVEAVTGKIIETAHEVWEIGEESDERK